MTTAAQRAGEVAQALAGSGPDPAGTAEESFGLWTVEVRPARWVDVLRTARDEFGLCFFDWLSAVDELSDGMRVVAHLLDPDTIAHLLISTRLSADELVLDSAVGVFRGANWHERETHEMFGIDFPGHPGLTPLLLPDTFEGHPLRKSFVLASRVAKAWPGAKEPGEGHGKGPRRKAVRPPGVPDPDEWGPDAKPVEDPQPVEDSRP